MRIAICKGGVLSYVHADHLGSSSVETNSSGSQTAFRSYYAYGATRSSSGSLQTDRTFTGQKQAPRGYPTGLLYYNARYYDPALGTFLSPDTLVPDAGRVVDYNRFLYVRGNPLKYNDPDGHCSNLATAGGRAFSDCSGGGGAESLGKAVVTLIAIALTADQQLNGAGTITRGTDVPPLREIVPTNPPQRMGTSGIPLDDQVAEPFVTTPVQVDSGALITVPPSTLRSLHDLLVTATTHEVYVVRDAQDSIIYVGRTMQGLRNREYQHQQQPGRKGWGLESYESGLSLEEARELEQELIIRHGLDRLENKRNEIAPGKWSERLQNIFRQSGGE